MLSGVYAGVISDRILRKIFHSYSEKGSVNLVAQPA